VSFVNEILPSQWIPFFWQDAKTSRRKDRNVSFAFFVWYFQARKNKLTQVLQVEKVTNSRETAIKFQRSPLPEIVHRQIAFAIDKASLLSITITGYENNRGDRILHFREKRESRE